MKNIWVFDIEGDGLKPSKIHCLSACSSDGGKIFSTTKYEDMRKFLLSAKVLIGHNIARWDIPVLEKLLDIKITAKLVDTLSISWYLYPERGTHNLDDWGTDVGIPKPKITNWDNLPIEEYIHRCEEDVRINTLVWKKMFRYLIELYGTQTALWKFLDYLQFKMYCARLQEQSRWKLDIPFVKKSLAELEKIKEDKFSKLIEVMPRVPTVQVKSKPKRFINANGDYSKLGQEWIKLLSERGLPPSHEEDVEIIVGSVSGNPNSTEQVKAWLYSYGWVPQTFKHITNKKTGEKKSIPQINQEQGKGICESIKDLYDQNPDLEYLEGLGVVSHRISILNGFLRDGEEGSLSANISGFTNTLRVKHAEIVNLPKVEKAYGGMIRQSLIADDGYILCGSDMASLEDRIKAHFIQPLDPEYVKTISADDYDPHILIAVMAGMMDEDAAANYKWVATLSEAERAIADKVKLDWAKRVKPIRDVSKNGNYSLQYGAGVARVALTCGISEKQAKILYDAYHRFNWAIKKVAEQQKYKTVNDQMWLFNPISKFWYSLRKVKDIFSTLVQGSASYAFDMWLQFVIEKRPQLTATFHDEFCLHIKEGAQEQCTALIREAILKTNEKLKLNRELDVSIQYGKAYGQIH